jgi:type II secretory pathway pseudopilin PulG
MKMLLRVLVGLVVAGIVIFFGGLVFLHLLLDRTREFRAQAKIGQPIVQAIEHYRKQTGEYPPSLAVLAPNYLKEAPPISEWSHHTSRGWDYRIVANDSQVTFNLLYYMGKGGVWYAPPNWYGSDNGHEKVILRND